MCTTGSRFLAYSYVSASVTMTRAFWRYPICRGPLDQSGSGSGHDTTQARAKLQLAIRELQYVLQHIVINEIIVRGSGGKNVIFSNTPQTTSEYFKLLYYMLI